MIFSRAAVSLPCRFYKVIAVSIISRQYAFLVSNSGQRFGRHGCGTKARCGAIR